MTEIHDRPENQGVANALKRAQQFLRIRWIPEREMPKTISGQTFQSTWPAFKPRIGLPYSLARTEEKFIGPNVSLETWMTALRNPQSVLYTRTLSGKGPRMSSWYGTVCTAYVCYCLDLKFQRPTWLWKEYPDVETLPLSSAQDVKLADTLLCSNHATIVTDIVRDEAGKVIRLTISESVIPLVTATEYSAAEFERYFIPAYCICRCRTIAMVPYEPSPFVKADGDPDLPPYEYNRTLMTDYGDKANYRLGETVEFCVFEPGWKELSVQGEDGREAARMEIAGPGVYSFRPARRGGYTACCLKADGESRPVRFHMTDLHVRPEVFPGGLKVFVDAEPCETLWEVRVFSVEAEMQALPPEKAGLRRHLFFSEESRNAGCVSAEGLSAGTYTVTAAASNLFGQYSSAAVTVAIPAGSE